MAADKEKTAKLKALQLTLDKLDKTYGKGSVMKLGDVVTEEIDAISSGSVGLDLALELVDIQEEGSSKSMDQNLQEKQL